MKMHASPPSRAPVQPKSAGRWPNTTPNCARHSHASAGTKTTYSSLPSGRPGPRTYREIAELKNLARKDVGTRIRKALKKLNQHLHGESHEDEDRLGEVLLALNECSSVRRAAKRLKLPKDVLKAFMEREGIKTRFVFEVEP
ncbi:MAG: hypothetical protein AVDCRST_MAG93-792 [uncultured Chloroflexia bacterium]|uniref:Uncharacterized protein n=1 Tax=uncultured Chloroflexia bacterium TaxID=1672391 RepID=A0A6J4HMZ4_9CHLR|nr:MAG: hypothetical protein AVDCRST_MAG93-792 [uncultured Chloroflexia bacterium]